MPFQLAQLVERGGATTIIRIATFAHFPQLSTARQPVICDTHKLKLLKNTDAQGKEYTPVGDTVNSMSALTGLGSISHTCLTGGRHWHKKVASKAGE